MCSSDLRGRRSRGHAARQAELINGEGVGAVEGLPEHAIASDPIDPEAARYAPRPPERLHWLRIAMYGVITLGIVWVVGALAWSWSQDQYYVGEDAGTVVIYRGVDASLPGLDLSTVYETSDLQVADLCSFQADQVRDGLAADDLAAAKDIIDNLVEQATPSQCEAG